MGDPSGPSRTGSVPPSASGAPSGGPLPAGAGEDIGTDPTQFPAAPQDTSSYQPPVPSSPTSHSRAQPAALPPVLRVREVQVPLPPMSESIYAANLQFLRTEFRTFASTHGPSHPSGDFLTSIHLIVDRFS